MSEDKDKKKRGLGRLLSAVAGRIILYTALVVLLAAAVLSVFLQSAQFEVTLADNLVAELQLALEKPVEIRGLSLDLLGGRLCISGLKVGSGIEGMPDPVFIDFVMLEFRPLELLQRRLRLEDIIVSGPEISVEIDAAGGTNLPAFKETGSEESFELQIERLHVSGGVLNFRGQSFGWGMESGQVDFNASRVAGNRYDGILQLRNLRVGLPEVKSLLADVSVDFTSGQGKLGGTASLDEIGGSKLDVARWSVELASGSAELDFRLETDLSLLAFSEEAGLAGALSCEGKLIYRGAEIEISGLAVAPEVEFAGINIENIRDRFSFSGGILKSESISAGVFGGDLAGRLDASLTGRDPEIRGELNFSGIPVSNLLEVAAIDVLNLDATLSASLSVNWPLPEPGNLELSGAVKSSWEKASVRPYRRAVEKLKGDRDTGLLDSAMIPLEISSEIEFSDGELTIADGSSVRTPLSRMLIRGVVREDTWRLDLRSDSLSSAEAALNLAALDRLLGGQRGPEEGRYPIASFVRSIETEGEASLDLSGSFENPVFNLQVKAPGVTYEGRDLGSGELKLSYVDGGFTIRELQFVKGDSVVDVSGEISFPAEGLSGKLKLNATEFDLVGIESLLGLEPQGLSGVLEGQLELNLGETLSGAGQVSGRDLKIGDLNFSRAKAELRFGDRWTLQDLEAVGPRGGDLRGSIDFDPATNDWVADLRAQAVPIRHYLDLFAPELDVSGLAELTVNAAGNGLNARGVLDFSASDIQALGLDIGSARGSVRADGRSAQITLTVADHTYDIEALMPDDQSQALRLAIRDQLLDFTALARTFIPDERFYFNVRGGATATINLGGEENLSAKLTVGQLDFGMEQFSVLTEGDVKLLLTGSRLEFESLRFRARGQEATLVGWIGFEDKARLNLNLVGGVDLPALNDFFDDFTFSGKGDVSLRLRGPLSNPELYGDAILSDAFVRHKDTDVAFSNIRGALKITGPRVEITEMTALFSQGLLGLNGFVDIDWAGLQSDDFQFNIEGSGLQFTLLEGLDALLDGTLIFRGGAQSSMLSGDITVRRALYTKRFDPEAEIVRLQQQQVLQVTSEELRNISLDLDIKGSDGIVVDNNFADMEVLLDLRLLGDMAEPVLTGRAEVSAGEIFYRDRKYSITRGVIDFVNPYQLEPYFDFRAVTQVKEYRVFLEFHGTMDRLFPELSSDPPVSTIDVLHLLAVGRIRDNPFPSDTEQLQEQLLGVALSGFITKQVTGELERRAERLFGIDRFRIDPFFPGGSNNLTPRITIGEQLTDRLSVIYSRNLAENTEQVMLVEYRLSPTMMLVGTQQEDGSFGIDLLLKHRFR